MQYFYKGKKWIQVKNSTFLILVHPQILFLSYYFGKLSNLFTSGNYGDIFFALIYGRPTSKLKHDTVGQLALIHILLICNLLK